MKKGLLEKRAAAQQKLEAAANSETFVQADFDAAKTEVDALDARLNALDEAEKRGIRPDGSKPLVTIDPKRTGEQRTRDDEARLRREFRLGAAILAVADGQRLEGVEAEVMAEAKKEAREQGLKTSGQIQLPSFMVEKRDQTVGSASLGGNTVATDLGGLVDVLRPRLAVQLLGAMVLPGLVGNLDLPRRTNLANAVWEGETTASDETDLNFDKISMTPKRLAAFTEYSRQLLVQSSVGIENIVRTELSDAVSRALDLAAINGSGSGQPLGLLNALGGGQTVAIGTNGGAPTWEHMVALETLISTANADIANMGYLTTPGVAGKLKTTKRDVAGNGFVWEGANAGSGNVNGYRALTSTQMPSNLTKGSASAICHAILFGNWQELIIGQWGGIDIIVDPYTRAKEAMVVVTINSFWDIAIKNLASFAMIKDATTA